MSTTRLRIEGMHCDGCAQRVKRVLEREPGVVEAEVSYKKGEATVQHDAEETPMDRLKEVVERAGYTSEIAA